MRPLLPSRHARRRLSQRDLSRFWWIVGACSALVACSTPPPQIAAPPIGSFGFEPMPRPPAERLPECVRKETIAYYGLDPNAPDIDAQVEAIHSKRLPPNDAACKAELCAYLERQNRWGDMCPQQGAGGIK